jgi:transposase/predicted transcriptional regulator
VITLKQKQKIIQHHMEGKSNRQIAILLRISKDTVNKYVSEYNADRIKLLTFTPNEDVGEFTQAFVEKPSYDSSNRKPVKITPEIISIVEECLALNALKRETGLSKQQMKKVDIHEHLWKLGFEISYTSVKRITRNIENKAREAFIRQEYFPGDVCEFDWGTVKLNINNEGYKKYQLAVFTPAFSNIRFGFLFRNQDTAAFQEAHSRFFSYCKGAYRTMVYDNMRVAVKKFVGLTEREPTNALTQLSIYYGFKFRFCNIRKGNEKGHVERSVEYIRRKAFSGIDKDCFDTLTEANDYLLHICDELNEKDYPKPTCASLKFQEEHQSLLPNVPAFESCIKTTGVVDKYSTIVVSQNHYSVPDHLVGQQVEIKTYSNKVVIIKNREVLALHERSFKSRDWVININHYLRTLKRKRGALLNSTALLQADTTIQEIYNHYYKTDPKTFLDVLEVINDRGVEQVSYALKELESLSPFDFGVDKVKVICDNLQFQHTLIADAISNRAMETLNQYDQLRILQGKKLNEERGLSV